jgi:hypothetical protein
MTHSKAIVTLTIGDHYRCQWEELCRSNWTQYADKHGYDLHCFKEPLDPSARAAARSPSWQKCLILSTDLAKRYEQIVWLDSDILINSSCAPCIASSVPVENVGGVNLWTAPGTAEFQRALFRLNEFWRSQKAVSLIPPCAVDYYISWGLPRGFNEVITASVLVLSPRHHKELLERVYYAYEDRGDSSWNYEMRPLSYEILRSSAVTMLDCRFSTSWSVQMALHYPFLLNSANSAPLQTDYNEKRKSLLRHCVNIAFDNSYFLHFGPRKAEMPLVDICRKYDEMEAEDPLNIRKLAALRSELAALKITLEERNAATATLKVREADLTRRLLRSQNELDSMKSSRSWTLTAPLRRINTFAADFRRWLPNHRTRS